MSELDHEVVCVMLKMCEISRLEVGGPRKVYLKIRVKTLMGTERFEVDFFFVKLRFLTFSENHVPPVNLKQMVDEQLTTD